MTTNQVTVEDLGLKRVTIEVNEHKVEMPDGPATGLEIKEAAIKQDVNIQANFVLQVQLPNGSSRVIGDEDKVPLTEHLAFTAIAPDDNS
jgi:hypothetical protein